MTTPKKYTSNQNDAEAIVPHVWRTEEVTSENKRQKHKIVESIKILKPPQLDVGTEAAVVVMTSRCHLSDCQMLQFIRIVASTTH